MAAADLPINGDGICIVCKKTPPPPESVTCATCTTPWHVSCLSSPPDTFSATAAAWSCPDCSPDTGAAGDGSASAAVGSDGGGLVASIRAIEADGSLTEREKARRRQELMNGGRSAVEKNKEVLGLFGDKFQCSFCMQLPERPVTTPCGHNFCLKCFQKWIGQGKRSCVKCRASIPTNMASQPRINSTLVAAIRLSKTTKPTSLNISTTQYHFIGNENRPETAFTTERAKKAGKANACSGQIFVTIAPDHFGPILAEHDPKSNKGVLVGESWADRMECRQWGVHFPHVAGIAGQSTYGAQSVALSGGYEDDEDHGEWFLYTGSGGRDLSGNKRTNKDQSFDQKFEKSNEALRVSCKKGYPVRVVRSHKEKRSAYAPETGVRYDGIYRIEKCWRKVGIQGFKVCRYLFVRCDNEPAPWTSDEQGDRPRPLPEIKELKKATDIIVRMQSPSWDYEEGCDWHWTMSPPESRKALISGNPEERKSGQKRKLAPSITKIKIVGSCPTKKAQHQRTLEKLLKGFRCLICWKVMTLPLTTPCAHNFCKICLLESYADQEFIRERSREGRILRAQKLVKKCPCCPNDIYDFVQNPQVNRDIMDLIESLQQKIKDENDEESNVEESDVVEKSGEDEIDDLEEEKLNHEGNVSVDDESDKQNSDDDNDEKLESVDGDSEVKNSEVGGGEKNCQIPVRNTKGKGQASVRPKQIRKTVGKKVVECDANHLILENGKGVVKDNNGINEGDEQDCRSPVNKSNTQVSRRQKKTVSRKRAGKNIIKNEEVTDILEDTDDDDEKMEEAGESSRGNTVIPEDEKEGEKHERTPGKGSTWPSPSNQSIRVTRQSAKQNGSGD